MWVEPVKTPNLKRLVCSQECSNCIAHEKILMQIQVCFGVHEDKCFYKYVNQDFVWKVGGLYEHAYV